MNSMRSVAATLAMAAGTRPSRAVKELSPARPASYVGYTTLVCVIALAAYQINSYQAGLMFIYGLSALGLDWIVGWAGQASLANGPLMAIGAIETAYISTRTWGNLGLSVLAALATGLVVGFVIGLPAVRVRGLYLVMVTLALQFIVVDGLEISQERVGGPGAGYSVGSAHIAWVYLNPFGRSFLVALVILYLAVSLILSNIYRRSPGRAWAVIREDEVAAAGMGIDVVRWKLAAFAGSSALIAVSGCLYAYYVQGVTYSAFSLNFALLFAVMVIVGGMRSLPGVLIGTVLVTFFSFSLQTWIGSLASREQSAVGTWLAQNQFVIADGAFGLLVILVVLFLPEGVVPGLERLVRRWRRDRVAARDHEIGIEVGPVKDHGLVSASMPLVSEAATCKPPVDLSVGRRPMLKVTDLQVTYASGARAVRGVSLAVHEGEMVAIVGRNGAGKTSTLQAIGGFAAWERVGQSGSVLFDGEETLGWDSSSASRRGVVSVPERDKIFPGLSAWEHLSLVRGEAVAELSVFADLFKRRGKTKAGFLSGGERQLLALAKAWAMKPRLLLIDEMSLGLSPVAINEIVEAVSSLARDQSVGVLLVEQSVAVARALADRLLLIDGGQVIVADDANVRGSANAALWNAYIGGGDDA